MQTIKNYYVVHHIGDDPDKYPRTKQLFTNAQATAARTAFYADRGVSAKVGRELVDSWNYQLGLMHGKDSEEKRQPYSYLMLEEDVVDSTQCTDSHMALLNKQHAWLGHLTVLSENHDAQVFTVVGYSQSNPHIVRVSYLRKDGKWVTSREVQTRELKSPSFAQRLAYLTELGIMEMDSNATNSEPD